MYSQSIGWLVGEVGKFDNWLSEKLASSSLTAPLIVTPTSKLLTEVLTVAFFLVLTYETVYWSGIYLGLWEYHAKDIFTEIPVHCAHVYVRLNIVDKDNLEKVRQYYDLKKDSRYNILNWKELNDLGRELFKLKQFVKYHFEFSPEDFEMNEHPEFGSTIDHLRKKTLHTFESSSLFKRFLNKNHSSDDLIVYNNNNEEIDHSQDLNYLSKCSIETGNVIDCIVLH